MKINEDDFAKCKLCRRSYRRDSGFAVTVGPITKRETQHRGTVYGVCVSCASTILGTSDAWVFDLRFVKGPDESSDA